jgi:hypothetical protein
MSMKEMEETWQLHVNSNPKATKRLSLNVPSAFRVHASPALLRFGGSCSPKLAFCVYNLSHAPADAETRLIFSPSRDTTYPSG